MGISIMYKLTLLTRNWALPWTLALVTVYGFIYLIGNSNRSVRVLSHQEITVRSIGRKSNNDYDTTNSQKLGSKLFLQRNNEQMRGKSQKCNPCTYSSNDALVKDVNPAYFEQLMLRDPSPDRDDPFYDCLRNEKIKKIHKIINHLPVQDPFTPYLYKCSIESEILDYPERCVVIWHNSSVRPEQLMKNPPKNLKFISLDVDTILADTPIVFWYKTFRNITNSYDSWDVSDGLRLAILYKYGGRYTDSDFISISKVKDTKMNFAYENWQNSRIANGYMEFPQRHPFILLSMWKFVFDFTTQRAKQGPILITNVFNWWKTNTIEKIGGEVKVSNRTALYPAHWKETNDLYNGNQNESIWEKIHKANMIHVWSHIRTDKRLTPVNGSIISQLMIKHCPISYQEYLDSTELAAAQTPKHGANARKPKVIPKNVKQSAAVPPKKPAIGRPKGANPKGPKAVIIPVKSISKSKLNGIAETTIIATAR